YHESEASTTVDYALNHAQPTWRVWRPEDQELGISRTFSNTIYLFFILTIYVLGWLFVVYAWY
ncbi:hypothetical protein ACQP3D_30920, partial [Escherichia coli]